MKKKNNHPTSDEIESNLEAKVDAYIADLRGALRSLPKSERASWLEREKPLEKLMVEAIGYAAAMLLLDAKLSQAQKNSPMAAKLTAQLFKSSGFDSSFMDIVRRAAETKNKQFFIDLGKCLSNQMHSEVWDKLDFEVAWILCINPKIFATAAVLVLKKFRNFEITEDNFRMRKMRLLRAVQPHGEARQAQMKT